MYDLFSPNLIDFETFRREAETEHRATGYGKGTTGECTRHFQTVKYKGKEYYARFDVFKIPIAQTLKEAYEQYRTDNDQATQPHATTEGKETA